LALATVLAFAGAAISSSFVSPDANPQPLLSFLLFLFLAGIIWVAAFSFNWLLSLAALFGVRDSEDSLGALSAAMTFSRRHSASVLAVSTVTALAHLAVFVCACSVASFCLAFLHILPTRLVIGICILVALAYFAVADWLYMARLAGYVCITEMPEEATQPIPPAPLPPSPRVQTAIDPDELILSDMPNLS
jgi:hypothetical protein